MPNSKIKNDKKKLNLFNKNNNKLSNSKVMVIYLRIFF